MRIDETMTTKDWKKEHDKLFWTSFIMFAFFFGFGVFIGHQIGDDKGYYRGLIEGYVVRAMDAKYGRWHWPTGEKSDREWKKFESEYYSNSFSMQKVDTPISTPVGRVNPVRNSDQKKMINNF